MSQGWVTIHRSIRDHWLWEDEPFTKAQAWIDLIMMANHEERDILLGSEVLKVKRGNIITSTVKLSNMWGWSRKKVSNFLDRLEMEQMIVHIKHTKRTALEIVNYEKYQVNGTVKEQKKEHIKSSKRTGEEHKQELKELEKLKKDKRKVFDFIYLTEIEHNKLLKDYGLEVTDTYLHRLDDYIGVIGEDVAKKKYKSHYHVIKSWYRKDKK